jgi:hypothetical protein
VIKFPAIVVAIAIMIGLFRLVGAGRDAAPFTVTIEATELWRNPWPSPGEQTYIADGACKGPSSVCAPVDDRQIRASGGQVRAAF